MLPIILIHKNLDHLIWVCTYNEKDEIESVLINKHTKETCKQKIMESQIPDLIKEFEKNGWTKGFIPDINIINDGKIVQTVNLNT
jgi:hypothetical protein